MQAGRSRRTARDARVGQFAMGVAGHFPHRDGRGVRRARIRPGGTAGHREAECTRNDDTAPHMLILTYISMPCASCHRVAGMGAPSHSTDWSLTDGVSTGA